MDDFTFTMFVLNLLLLFCFIKYREISSVGNTPRSVTGGKGGHAILSCDFEDRDISDIDLSRFSKIILDCQNNECKRENRRLLKKGSCDIIIKDLIFSDAGKYILRVYYNNTKQTKVKRQILEYHLHLHDEISGKTGEELKLDVLLINADKVEKNSSGEWTEVWTRGHGVRSGRLTVRDGKLIIKSFTSTDSGTYRVLDSEGEILITVTVTDSKGNLNTDKDETEHLSYWILGVGLTVLLILLALTAVVLYLYLHRDCDQGNSRRRRAGLRS